jgi:hypothetical protein
MTQILIKFMDSLIAFHGTIILGLILLFIYYCYSRTLAFITLSKNGYPTIEHSSDAYGKETTKPEFVDDL